MQAKETVRSMCIFSIRFRSQLTSIAGSTFMQTMLSTGFPRLLRLFQEFFSKIAVHTDTVYTQAQQRFVLSCVRRMRSDDDDLTARKRSLFCGRSPPSKLSTSLVQRIDSTKLSRRRSPSLPPSPPPSARAHSLRRLRTKDCPPLERSSTNSTQLASIRCWSRSSRKEQQEQSTCLSQRSKDW